MPGIDPLLAAPQVLDGYDAAGAPRCARRSGPITLRHLLTHTAGFTYRLWDAQALRYQQACGALPARKRTALPHLPLMFEPGTRWQYGTNIDWVGKIVETVSGERLDVYFREHILGPLGYGRYRIHPHAGATRPRSIRPPAQAGRHARRGAAGEALATRRIFPAAAASIPPRPTI